jgi:hypothetical protein
MYSTRQTVIDYRVKQGYKYNGYKYNGYKYVVFHTFKLTTIKLIGNRPLQNLWRGKLKVI